MRTDGHTDRHNKDNTKASEKNEHNLLRNNAVSETVFILKVVQSDHTVCCHF